MSRYVLAKSVSERRTTASSPGKRRNITPSRCKVRSVKEFLTDPRLVAFVLGANGIDTKSVDAEFMAKIFTSISMTKSFVNQQADNSYRKIVASFNLQCRRSGQGARTTRRSSPSRHLRNPRQLCPPDAGRRGRQRQCRRATRAVFRAQGRNHIEPPTIFSPTMRSSRSSRCSTIAGRDRRRGYRCPGRHDQPLSGSWKICTTRKSSPR